MVNADAPENDDGNTAQFRKESTDYQIHSQNHYHLIKVTSLMNWVIISPVAALILFGLYWGIWGTIFSRVEGKGILLPSEQNLYTATLQDFSGKLQKYYVKAGDTVKEGQPIAYLVNDVLKGQILEGKIYIQDLKAIYEKLVQKSEVEIAENKKKYLDQKKLLTDYIVDLGKFIDFLEKNLIQAKELLAKKIVVLLRVETLFGNIKSAQESVERSKVQLIQTEQQSKEFIDKWETRLKDLEIKIRSEQHENNKLFKQLESITQILSPVDGTVLNLQKTVGDFVNKGDSVATLSSTHGTIDAIIFVNPEEGKKIKIGMTVLVTPSFIKSEEFGGIYAEVTSVSDIPANKNRMMAVLQNENLAKILSPNDHPPIEVRARLKVDPRTFSGFAWSSSKGPRQKITSGILLNARILVRKQSPFSLIIPALHKVMGE